MWTSLPPKKTRFQDWLTSKSTIDTIFTEHRSRLSHIALNLNNNLSNARKVPQSIHSLVCFFELEGLCNGWVNFVFLNEFAEFNTHVSTPSAQTTLD